MPGGPDGIASRVTRLAGFVGASFVLHVATLVGVPSWGVASAPYRGATQPEALHATLSIPQRAQPAASSATQESPSQAPQADATTDARSGAPAGADVPMPDKWYTATEVDVRAEPIGAVDLSYPEELDGTGIRGRVQLLIHIDERGVVRKMRITRAEPERVFDRTALSAWNHVRFSPAQKGGVAVKSQKLLELDFLP